MGALEGGLTFRMDSAEKSKGKANAIKFYGSVNLPGYIHICRYALDNNKDDSSTGGVPTWITEGYQV